MSSISVSRTHILALNKFGSGYIGMRMKTYLEINEVEQLENAATCLRDKLLIRLLARLGCRISEALALGMKDIDFTRGMVTIEHLKSRVELACPQCGARLRKPHAFCAKCGMKVERTVAREKQHRRMRTLPIDDDTFEMLKGYIKRGGPVFRNGKKTHLRHQQTQGLAGRQGLRR